VISAHTKSPEDTQTFAAAVARALQDGDMVLLIGEIGAGKTTFAQGFGSGLGVEDAITSPTFVLLHTYKGRIPLHHVDIYRLDHLQEVIDLGLMELLDEGGIALVEWGDLASPVLPRDRLEIHLRIDSDSVDARNIEMRGVGSIWTRRERDVAPFVSAWTVEVSPGDEQ
jgi:tRNA threonylcarbamoyladenosine biosynthesis protein TsaE